MGLSGSKLSGIADALGSEDTWYCDGCHSVLNEQDGFNTCSGRWVCTECGYDNDVPEDNLPMTSSGLDNLPGTGSINDGASKHVETVCLLSRKDK